MRWLIAFLALLASGCAHAQTPFGFQTSNGATAIIQLADFSSTLTGYGGVATIGGALLTAQTPQLISAGTAGCQAGDFVVDGNLMLSPNNAAGGAGPRTWDGHTVSTSFGYGSLSATYAYTGACIFSVVNANGATILVPMTFSAGLHHIRAINAADVISGIPADTATVNQLSTWVAIASSDATGRNLHLGDTISGRSSQLNPNSATSFSMTPPVGGYTGAGVITITSDVPVTTTDAEGNPMFGGGFKLGELAINNTSFGDHIDPFEFSYVGFYTDAVSPQVSYFVRYQNNGHSAGFDHVTVTTGPDVNPTTLVGGIQESYLGADTTATGTGISTTITDSYFSGLGFAISVINGQLLANMGGKPTVSLIAKRNIMTGVIADYIDFNGTGSDIEDNFMSTPNPCCGNHEDSLQIFSTSIGGGPYSYTVKNNIVVRNNSAPGSGVYHATITNGGTGFVTASGLFQPLIGGTGKYANVSAITASGGIITGLTFAVDEGGVGYTVGDVLTLQHTGTCCVSGANEQITVAAPLGGRQDFQGPPFFNNLGTDTYSGCTVQNNTFVGTFGNGTENYCSAANENYNTYVNDFQADAGAGSPAGTGLAVTIVTNNTTGSGNWDNNITNSFGFGGSTLTNVTISGSTMTTTNGTGVQVGNQVYASGITAPCVVSAGSGTSWTVTGAGCANISGATVLMKGNYGPNTCYPGTFTATATTNSGCNTGTQALARSLVAYQGVWGAYNTLTTDIGTRAKAIAMMTPSLNGSAKNGNGSYSGPYTPADSAGVTCLNTGLTNFDNTKTCVAQGLTPAA